MIIRLYRKGLLALRRSLPRSMRNFISRRWLLSAKRLMADAETMSPVPLSQQTTEEKRHD